MQLGALQQAAAGCAAASRSSRVRCSKPQEQDAATWTPHARVFPLFELARSSAHATCSSESADSEKPIAREQSAYLQKWAAQSIAPGRRYRYPRTPIHPTQPPSQVPATQPASHPRHTPEKKFKQFDDSLKINRHTKLSSSFFQVFFSTPNSLMIVLVTPNYHQLLLDTENYRKTIIK